ncbi:hypothetical protein Cs308_0294 [Candidatus Chlamydia sanziniae]|uniref:Uncharacterized protein n=1 Tax=Candidatus Chlamydia sanziniae TaxID=1806891 RepID=A0A1A9HUE7_9CHLA|nr:hypothetical protein Cs308_0294 [Candidatus Chlamydia sanziniae]
MEWSKIIFLSLFLSPIGVNVGKEFSSRTVFKVAKQPTLLFSQDVFPIYEIIEPVSPACLVHYEGWV